MDSSKKLYKAISRRRVSSSLITQQIWDAINNICYQRQQPNVERIARYMSRIHGVSEEEVRRQLIHCERDGLIKHVTRTGCKGKTTGLEQEVYSIPTTVEYERDGHDWYCFECHGSGDVICCTTCHRVYHVACLPDLDPLDDDAHQNFSCATCKACSAKEALFGASCKKMNQLLVYTCARLKERVPVSLTERQVPSKCSNVSGDRTSTPKSTPGTPGNNLTWVLQDDQMWRAHFLLLKTVNIISMESKAENSEYSSFAEFEADAATVVHNVVIYHGASSSIADMVRQMLTDCKYDISEMRNCKDCYRRSNERTTSKFWFCLPCKPHHTLVYAKQKGYPFWPAKVIKIDGDMYDVRFFGGPHERAILEKTAIRPITSELSSLGIKKSASWNKAYEELRKHQQMLTKVRASSPSSASDNESSQPPPKRKKIVATAKRGRMSTGSESGKKTSGSESGKKTSGSESGKKTSGSESGKKTPGSESGKKTPGSESGKRTSGSESGKKTPGSESGNSGRQQGKRQGVKRTLPSLMPTLNLKREETSDESSDDEKSVSSTCLPNKPFKEAGEEDLVSSSCTEPRSRSIAIQTPPKLLKQGNARNKKKAKDTEEVVGALEKARRDWDKEKTSAINALSRQHEKEMERLRANQAVELAEIQEQHKLALHECKRKQWCYNCEAEAIYHCCWNTSYCSIECQQSHWHNEHKRNCRRKR